MPPKATQTTTENPHSGAPHHKSKASHQASSDQNPQQEYEHRKPRTEQDASQTKLPDIHVNLAPLLRNVENQKLITVHLVLTEQEIGLLMTKKVVGVNYHIDQTGHIVLTGEALAVRIALSKLILTPYKFEPHTNTNIEVSLHYDKVQATHNIHITQDHGKVTIQSPDLPPVVSGGGVSYFARASDPIQPPKEQTPAPEKLTEVATNHTVVFARADATVTTSHSFLFSRNVTESTDTSQSPPPNAASPEPSATTDASPSSEPADTGHDPPSPPVVNITAGGGSSNAMPVVDTPLADQAATEDAAFSYTVPVASFSDPEGSALTYNATLTSGGALPVWLSFDPATLTFSGTPDNTAVGTINLRVTATDAQGATVSDDFDLTIANTNDAPTAVTLSAGSAAETLGVGGTVATISGTDDDSIHGDTLTYSIVADPDGKFAIAGNLLQLAAGIDFETATSHNVTIRATDSGGAFFDQAFTVNVTDANEAPGAITDSNAVANNVAENAANATLVGITAHAVDPEGGAITYSLTDNAGGRFAINATTGVVSVANGSLLDYETATSHAITVQASDGSNNTTQNFTVNLTNTNDAPTNILISSGNMDENSTIGTAIGTLSAVDADVGDTHTYSIVSDPDGKFSLAGNTLQVNGLLNHEIKATHNVTIRVSDGTATYDKVLAIGVNDINDAPLYANKTFSLAESATNGTTVGTATAIDEDGDTLTYSITGGNTDNIFAVNASTGVVNLPTFRQRIRTACHAHAQSTARKERAIRRIS